MYHRANKVIIHRFKVILKGKMLKPAYRITFLFL